MKIVLITCILLQGCSVYYSPHGGGKAKGRGGVIIKVPPQKPEVKPIPESKLEPTNNLGDRL
ncbi:hypothetical protein NBRC116188_09330 [Oceaniserpentilla sp. 4NH20-0058]